MAQVRAQNDQDYLFWITLHWMITYDTENNLLTSRPTEAFTYITYEMSREKSLQQKRS